ncbi:MAG TPA: ribosome biogenesis GTPase Der [Steroidobacteraceae bacterium]|nr:ribosome biogenesis GTPase Der [Steroidobacteraceae bacterium]
MLPVIAIVGRPNVGKSTLFNVLTGTRDALVADLPGLTRDRQYGYGRRGGRYIVVDTGGLVVAPSGVETLMAAQTERAVAEADRVLFVVDARAGPTPEDAFVAGRLRRSGKPVIVAANKAEGQDADIAAGEFQAFGLGQPVAISAAHGEGLDALVGQMLAGLAVAAEEPAELDPDAIRIAVVGRPNVGKSTLINRLIGEERLVAYDEPGTTRDSVHVPFERDGHRYVLIDTAGVRRRARVEDAVEKFSVIKALQAIDDAHVVIGVLDAHETVAEQDATLLGHVAERGRALILAVNKWDHIPPEQRDHIKNQLALKVPFLDFAPQHFISALHGTGVGDLLGAARRAARAALRELPTPELTRVLEKALEAHQPPLVRGRRIKLRYAHQGGRNPPLIVVHGNQVAHVPEAYRRYLVNTYREAFRLHGTPVKVEFRSDTNPYAGRRNELSERQKQKRRRLIKHKKRR